MGRSDRYRELLESEGASFETWRDADVVSTFGEFDDEFEALVGGVAIADRSERETVVADGADVVPLLQGLVLGDLFKLADEGSGQLNAAVNVNGRYVTELRLAHVAGMLLIDLEPGMIADGALSHFKRQIINEDAKLHDRSAVSSKLLIAGPQAGALLDEGDWSATRPSGLRGYDGTWGNLFGTDVIVQRIPDFGVDAWELLVDAADAAELWTELSQRATPVGLDVLETARIEHGTPRWGVELDEKIIPLEAGMSWMIAFDKGCYLGQEIIARLDTRGTPAKELRAIDLGDAEPPESGTEITQEGKKIGQIRAAIRSPRSGMTIAHAFLKRGHNEPGLEVRVGDETGVIRRPGFALIDDAEESTGS